MSRNRINHDRRTFLKWAAGLGLTAIAGNTVKAVADSKEERDEKSPLLDRDDVYHTHVTELASMQAQLNRVEQLGDPEVLYNPALTRHLDENPEKDSFHLYVITIGEESVVQEKRGPERMIHGWRPRESEVDHLSDYGEIGFVPRFIATKVYLRDVKRSNIPKLAELPFVLEINWVPPLGEESSDYDYSCFARSDNLDEGVHVDDLRSSNYFKFDEVNRNEDWLFKVGIADTGYAGHGHSLFAESYAEEIGLDEELAKNFTEGAVMDGPDWRNPSNSCHGDDVADMCAYMLQHGHDELFVPLKVKHTSQSPSETAEYLSEAIEYAEEHHIDILNMSLGIEDPLSYCPSTFCEELKSYTEAGHFPVASTGNQERTDAVTFPGGEWFTIGIGGVFGSCEGGDYQIHYESNRGTITFETSDETHCHWCATAVGSYSSHFSPQAHGCYSTETDSNEDENVLSGTSYAAAQASAVALVMRSNYLLDYEEALSNFKEMESKWLCPITDARHGQLIDAELADDQTS